MAQNQSATYAHRFQTAFQLHQEGRLSDAQELYAGLLLEDSHDFNVLHLFGLSRFQLGDPFGAVEMIGRAVAKHPLDPSAQSNLGLALDKLGRLEEAVRAFDVAVSVQPNDPEIRFNRALSLYRGDQLNPALADLDRAIALRPDYAEAHQHRGLVLHGLSRHAEALDAFQYAIALNPAAVDAYVNCAAALEKLGRWEDAVAACDIALILNPNAAEAHLNRSVALQGLGRFAEMLLSCDAALTVRPEFTQAYLNRGVALKGLGRYAEALVALDAALVLNGSDAVAHTQRGVVLEALGDLSAALESHLRAIARDPTFAEAHCNAGVVLHALGRYEDALTYYVRALELSPADADILTHRGVVLEKLDRPSEALASYDEAVSHDPSFARAYVNRSHLLLSLGEFERGWRDYEWRKNSERPVGDRVLAAPLLGPGDDVAGRTVLIHWEQGFGDTIQFARFLRPLHERGAKVLFAPQPQLKTLMTSLGPFVTIVSLDDPTVLFDFHCPLLSLPRALSIDLDALGGDQQYLSADPYLTALWRSRSRGSPRRPERPRIGLAWAGSAAHKNDAARSMPLEAMAPLLSREATFVSLQKEHQNGDLQTMQFRHSPLDVAEELKDFSDTAALIAALDLVICVDTAVAHLAGALGKPFWLLLAKHCDWRWLRGRSESPWYSTARLFRQTTRGDWQSVIAEVAIAIDIMSLAYAP